MRTSSSTPLAYIAVDDSAARAALDVFRRKLSISSQIAFFQSSVKPYLASRASARFASEGASDVGKWAALKPSTARIREALGIPGIGGYHPINQRTGDLRTLMTSGADPEYFAAAEYVEMRYPGDSVQTGDRSYKVLQAQGMINQKTARPVVYASGIDAVTIAGLFSAFLKAGPDA